MRIECDGSSECRLARLKGNSATLYAFHCGLACCERLANFGQRLGHLAELSDANHGYGELANA